MQIIDKAKKIVDLNPLLFSKQQQQSSVSLSDFYEYIRKNESKKNITDIFMHFANLPSFEYISDIYFPHSFANTMYVLEKIRGLKKLKIDSSVLITNKKKRGPISYIKIDTTKDFFSLLASKIRMVEELTIDLFLLNKLVEYTNISFRSLQKLTIIIFGNKKYYRDNLYDVFENKDLVDFNYVLDIDMPLLKTIYLDFDNSMPIDGLFTIKINQDRMKNLISIKKAREIPGYYAQASVLEMMGTKNSLVVDFEFEIVKSECLFPLVIDGCNYISSLKFFPKIEKLNLGFNDLIAYNKPDIFPYIEEIALKIHSFDNVDDFFISKLFTIFPEVKILSLNFTGFANNTFSYKTGLNITLGKLEQVIFEAKNHGYENFISDLSALFLQSPYLKEIKTGNGEYIFSKIGSKIHIDLLIFFNFWIGSPNSYNSNILQFLPLVEEIYISKRFFTKNDNSIILSHYGQVIKKSLKIFLSKYQTINFINLADMILYKNYDQQIETYDFDFVTTRNISEIKKIMITGPRNRQTNLTSSNLLDFKGEIYTNSSTIAMNKNILNASLISVVENDGLAVALLGINYSQIKDKLSVGKPAYSVSFRYSPQDDKIEELFFININCVEDRKCFFDGKHIDKFVVIDKNKCPELIFDKCFFSDIYFEEDCSLMFNKCIFLKPVIFSNLKYLEINYNTKFSNLPKNEILDMQKNKLFEESHIENITIDSMKYGSTLKIKISLIQTYGKIPVINYSKIKGWKEIKIEDFFRY